MKRIFTYIVLLSFVACRKDTVETPDFDVQVADSPMVAGQPVRFVFSGNPNFISFYSGETGRQYEHSDRTKLSGTPSLNFLTYRQFGSQENSLQLKVSSDFKGSYTIDGIQAATWKDLTSKVVLSTGDDNTPSGNVDLSDIAAEGKPVYFAFRKYDENHPTLKPRTWTIRTFDISLLSANNVTYPVVNLTNAGWLAIDVLNATYKWSISTARLYIGGGNPNTPENEDWVITKAITLNDIPVAPDPGIPVKGIDTRADSFQYTFASPGTYKVAFVVSNQTVHGKQSQVKELTLTIAP